MPVKRRRRVQPRVPLLHPRRARRTDVRIFKGFSVSQNGAISRRRDQLSLRRGEATTEEILVRQRELATDYSYDLGFGISYSFGSIFNNVVNPRFRNAGGF